MMGIGDVWRKRVRPDFLGFPIPSSSRDTLTNSSLSIVSLKVSLPTLVDATYTKFERLEGENRL